MEFCKIHESGFFGIFFSRVRVALVSREISAAYFFQSCEPNGPTIQQLKSEGNLSLEKALSIKRTITMSV